jgi:predicted dehydrogenase/aryl-alcohol dehydrogenase-like predicted oxidoreductase
MDRKLSWGILGAGTIAKTFAKGVLGSTSGRLAAVGSRSAEKAKAFAAEFAIPAAHASYEALLADEAVQAVYVATPHPMHAEWAIKAAEAGKHLLVEKPIAVNHADAMAIVETAIAHDVFLMDGFMYRCHPQTARVIELIRAREIGEVRSISATFSFHWPKNFDGKSRLLNNEMAGGGILDVGCYPTSMCRLIAGAAMGKAFAEPVKVEAVGHLGKTGVDEYSAAVLKFENDIIAQCATGVQLNQENAVRIYGTSGSIFIPTPWVPAKEGGTTKIIVKRDNKPDEEITIESPRHLYALEADVVAENISRRQAPQMSWEDSLGNMRTLDRWRSAIGLTYEIEKPAKFRRTTVAGRALSLHRNTMRYGAIPHLEKKPSRLVMGVDNQTTLAHAAVMFDDFVERGGNFFDTAHIYAGGLCERALGQWVKVRGMREDVVILGKGAHTPFCDPASLVRQLDESLGRLEMDYVDIYMLHRDNPAVPIGEFVDVLNNLLKQKKMRAFGGSNWSIDRVAAANEYAKGKGLQGFSAVSNNFSLARMVQAPWAGCISASDEKSREWFKKTQTPLLAWSSQARGFFIPGRAAPEKREDEELVRCWYAEDNFKRLERVNELAKKRGVLPINIALAYVLCQPFPTFALIGPRQLSETRTSLAGLDVALSADEVKWLNLE